MLDARNDLPFGAQHLDCKIKLVKKGNCGESWKPFSLSRMKRLKSHHAKVAKASQLFQVICLPLTVGTVAPCGLDRGPMMNFWQLFRPKCCVWYPHLFFVFAHIAWNCDLHQSYGTYCAGWQLPSIFTTNLFPLTPVMPMPCFAHSDGTYMPFRISVASWLCLQNMSIM
jgi:hypothetical protein